MKIDSKVKNFIENWRIADNCKIWVSKSKELMKIPNFLRIEFQKKNRNQPICQSREISIEK